MPDLRHLSDGMRRGSESPGRRLRLSLVAGFALSVALMGAAVFLPPVVGDFILLSPGRLMAPVIGSLVPSGIASAVAPDGGPTAAVALFAFGSFLFWWLALAIGSYLLALRR